MKLCSLSTSPQESENLYALPYYLDGHPWQHYALRPADLTGQLQALCESGVDIFLNFCDGTPEDGFSAIELACALEEVGAAFSGAGSGFADPTREEMKAAAVQAGVPIPRGCFVKKESDFELAARSLRFPLIVKPPHGYSSIGLTPDSRATGLPGLAARGAQVLAEFGAALVEEFIEGREFTVLAAVDPDHNEQPRTFQPVEFLFPSGESFKHYQLKWVNYARMQARPVSEPQVDAALRDYTRRIFRAMHGDGYARCDYRMDAGGNLYFLEINPNCGIFYAPDEPGSADLCLIHDPLGQRGFMELLLRQAQARKK
jgi:D-alanine-D-alanine ligase